MKTLTLEVTTVTVHTVEVDDGWEWDGTESLLDLTSDLGEVVDVDARLVSER